MPVLKLTAKSLSLALAVLGASQTVEAAYLPGDGETYRVTHNLFGRAGLIEMPNAFFFEDGQFSTTAQHKQPDDRVTLTFQATPWFEGSFRYSVIRGFNKGVGSDDLFDRSFDFKVRLSKQKGFWPATALGIQDFGGTGIYGGEYLVASWATKKVNVTAGLGFGRLGSRGDLTNPFIAISEKFRHRGTFDGIEETGQLNIDRFFRGEDTALFGGIEYLTPIKGLKAIIEYSGDEYKPERARQLTEVDSPINLGLTYKPNDWLEGGLSYINGNQVSLRMTIRTNPGRKTKYPRIDRPRLPYKMRETTSAPNAVLQRMPNSRLVPAPNGNELVLQESVEKPVFSLKDNYLHASFQADLNTPVKRIDYTQIGDYRNNNNELQSYTDVINEGDKSSQVAIFAQNTYQSLPGTPSRIATKASLATPLDASQEERIRKHISKLAGQQQIGIEAIILNGAEVSVYFKNAKYSRDSEAIGRLMPILTLSLPDNIEIFHLIPVAHGVSLASVTINRSALERTLLQNGSSEELFNASYFEAGPAGYPPGKSISAPYPRYAVGISPTVQHSLFDPDDPLRIQVAAKLRASLEVAPGLELHGVYRFDLYNTLEDVVRESNSILPRVRSDAAKYFRQGQSGVDQLAVYYHRKLTPNLYGRVAGGLFEEMFGGIGGEILYRPYGKRWAVSFDAFFMKQRDYDRGFKFLDYETVTAFTRFYYDTPFYDMRAQVDVGRYLAKDIGATFSLTRRFRNGTELGAFFTLTDVPFEDFGEGSFDKGIILKIPFHTLSLVDTRRSFSTVIRPLSRDGGAQPHTGRTLYTITDPFNFGDLRRNWEGVFD